MWHKRLVPLDVLSQRSWSRDNMITISNKIDQTALLILVVAEKFSSYYFVNAKFGASLCPVIPPGSNWNLDKRIWCRGFRRFFHLLLYREVAGSPPPWWAEKPHCDFDFAYEELLLSQVEYIKYFCLFLHFLHGIVLLLFPPLSKNMQDSFERKNQLHMIVCICWKGCDGLAACSGSRLVRAEKGSATTHSMNKCISDWMISYGTTMTFRCIWFSNSDWNKLWNCVCNV